MDNGQTVPLDDSLGYMTAENALQVVEYSRVLLKEINLFIAYTLDFFEEQGCFDEEELSALDETYAHLLETIRAASQVAANRANQNLDMYK